MSFSFSLRKKQYTGLLLDNECKKRKEIEHTVEDIKTKKRKLETVVEEQGKVIDDYEKKYFELLHEMSEVVKENAELTAANKKLDDENFDLMAEIGEFANKVEVLRMKISKIFQL